MASFDATDDLNFYASAAKGFRVGGVNGNISETLCGDELDRVGLDPASLRTYDSDDLWSYEVGVKSNLANNRMSLNAAVFFIDWQDSLQVQRLACGFQVDANIGDVESTGFEIELSAAPIEGLTFDLGVGYTNTEVVSPAATASRVMKKASLCTAFRTGPRLVPHSTYSPPSTAGMRDCGPTPTTTGKHQL